MTWEIEFSIGPVQGFVAQSRRTRDLWGSSYLLSYLSACAMLGAVQGGGEIRRPKVDGDPLYRWVAGDRVGTPPRIGSVPNRFTILTDAEPRRAAAAAVDAFHAASRGVHQAVWKHYLSRARVLGNGTEEIWQRQVDSCWEIAWVAGEEGEPGGLLARRKHWRTHRLPDEPGDKCTVMPDFQELSGHDRARGGTDRQQAFWAAVRGNVGVLELREDERLCAPALVKRFFPKIGRSAIGGELDVDHWPSTLYIGAVPWLEDVCRTAVDEAAEFMTAIRDAVPREAVRRAVPLEVLRDAKPSGFFQLDANYYHRSFLADPRRSPLKRGKEGERRRLGDLLARLQRAATGAPPVYYAFLLADGDHLGKLVAALGSDEVGAALSVFSAQVTPIVHEHRGVTVYAGGDDVLAMLPVPAALNCADRLATAFAAAFAPHPATLSASIVFAHVRMPVGGVLHAAHELLDDVAKDANGRDSLVATVMKPGGPRCRWVTSWTRRYLGGRSERAVTQVNQLKAAMTGQDGERGFSASLLHHTRDTLGLLCELRQWEPGKTGRPPAGLDLHAYIRAEIVDSWDDRVDDPDGTRLAELTDLVVDLLYPSYGPHDDGTPSQVDTTRAGVDALLLARFLAGGGREEDHG